MSLVGGQARIKITGTTASSSTDNAATLSTSGLVLSIDSTAKRHFNRATTTHVKIFEDATNRTTDIASVNSVLGQVTLDQARSTSATWTMDVEHLPASYLGQANAWSIDVDVTMNDVTAFSTVASSTGDIRFRKMLPGLAGADADLSRFAVTGTTAAAFFDRLTSTQDLVLELVMDSNTRKKLEGFAYVSEDGYSAEIDGLAEEEVGFTFDDNVYLSTA